MENVKELVIQGFYLALFLLAILFFTYSTKILDNLEKQGKENIYTGTKVMYQQNNSNDENVDTISYEQLCCMLMFPLAYNIKVDSLMLDKNVYDVLNFDFRAIEKKTYRRTYFYDNVGNIKEVEYIGEKKR